MVLVRSFCQISKDYRGDQSDNIIGIKGIGEKTATNLIQKFGSIENIYKKLKKDKEEFEKAGIKERIVGLLEEGEEEANFSKMLGTIRRDAPIDFEIPEKTWKESIDSEKVISLWSDLEFRTLGARLKDSSRRKAEAMSLKMKKFRLKKLQLSTKDCSVRISIRKK